jgi:hypothetical protein
MWYKKRKGYIRVAFSTSAKYANLKKRHQKMTGQLDIASVEVYVVAAHRDRSDRAEAKH